MAKGSWNTLTPLLNMIQHHSLNMMHENLHNPSLLVYTY